MDDLSLGPINPYDPEIRGEWLDKELGELDWREFVNTDSDLPIKSLSHSGRLIAWYAPNCASSYAGFLWWLSRINSAPCAVLSVPDLHFQGTEAMVKLIGQEADLTPVERNQQRKEWQALKNENALLRVLQDGQLVSASLDFFDHLIIQFLTDEWQEAIRVVGNSCSTIGIETGHFINDLFICSRLRALARSGAIEWNGDRSEMRTSHVRLANRDL